MLYVICIEYVYEWVNKGVVEVEYIRSWKLIAKVPRTAAHLVEWAWNLGWEMMLHYIHYIILYYLIYLSGYVNIVDHISLYIITLRHISCFLVNLIEIKRINLLIYWGIIIVETRMQFNWWKMKWFDVNWSFLHF